MKEIGMMFQGPLVRAILELRKQQTRRLVKPQPGEGKSFTGIAIACSISAYIGKGHWAFGEEPLFSEPELIRPHALPGDRIYVRETYWAWGRWETRYSEAKGRDEWHFVDMTAECGQPYLYAADGISQGRIKRNGGVTPTYWRRPALLMPKAATRIWLEVTAVRAERLNDISEADAQAEGCSIECMTPTGDDGGSAIHGPGGFAALWESTGGDWAANPWVWVTDFKLLSSTGKPQA